MSELPYGWEYSTLEELGLPKSTNIDPRNYPQETFELYSVPSYSTGFPEIVRGSKIGSAKQAVQPGDVLLCKIVPHLVRVWVVPEKQEHRLIASGEWILVRSSLCNPLYIRRLLMEEGFRERFMETVSGVGGSLLRARPKAVATIPVPIAPRQEQDRIVAKLDSLFERTRRAREELSHVPLLIEHYKQALLSAAFRGDLTADWRKDNPASNETLNNLENTRRSAWSRLQDEGKLGKRYKSAVDFDWSPVVDLPEGWIFASVDQLVVMVQYGSSAKASETQEGVPVLRMGNIQNGELDFSSLKYLPEDHQEFPELLLDRGDILFNRTNSQELVGKTAVFHGEQDKVSFASYLIRLKACGMEPELLASYINSAYGRDWVASVVSQQVGQANVNGTKLRHLAVPVMPRDEQREIMSRVQEAIASIRKIAVDADAATLLIDHLDQANLAKAFQGELVPQEPNEEPASVLLDRIRDERACQPKAKRGPRKKKSNVAA